MCEGKEQIKWGFGLLDLATSKNLKNLNSDKQYIFKEFIPYTFGTYYAEKLPVVYLKFKLNCKPIW